MSTTTKQLQFSIENYWYFSKLGFTAARLSDIKTTSACINEMALITAEPYLPKHLKKCAKNTALQLADLCPDAMSDAIGNLVKTTTNDLTTISNQMIIATGLQAEIELEERDIGARRAAMNNPTVGRQGRPPAGASTALPEAAHSANSREANNPNGAA